MAHHAGFVVLEDVAVMPSSILRNRRIHGYAGVVKLVVGQQRAVVTLRAVRLLDEETKPGDFLAAQNVHLRLPLEQLATSIFLSPGAGFQPPSVLMQGELFVVPSPFDHVEKAA